MKQLVLWTYGLFFICPFLWAEDSVWSRTIQLPKVRETTYELLGRISEATGFQFIYDSNLIDNDKKLRISEGEYTLKQAIYLATQDNSLQMRLVDKHILLYKSASVEATKNAETVTPDTVFIAEGLVRDKISREVLPYASITLSKTGMGTITNSDGKFQLKIPDSLKSASIHISYMGYESQTLPVALLKGNSADIYLNMQVIPIPEVIVHLVNPQKIVSEMLDKRTHNYPENPVFLTTFYREGVERRNKVASLTEAVFKIYKRPYHSLVFDQVKLLKMRKIEDENEADSLMLRMKAGIEASLLLDLVKNLPDFFILDNENLYNYAKIDMTTIDSHLAHVVAFEQKPNVHAPMFKGELYIDAENSALLNARFEYNPQYIDKAKEFFVIKQSRHLDIGLESAVYTVSYKEWNGKYYLNYIRGDLQFNIKKKKRIFQRSNIVHSYFEMTTCQTDTTDVKSFSGKERLPINRFFSETKFTYDPRFWGDFNVVLPNENLSEALKVIAAKVEEIETDND